MLVFAFSGERALERRLELHVRLFDRVGAAMAPLLHEVLFLPSRSPMIEWTENCGRPAEFMAWITPIQNMDFYVPAGACKLASLRPASGGPGGAERAYFCRPAIACTINAREPVWMRQIRIL